MRDDPSTCYRCAEPTATEILGALSGAHETIALTVHGMPVEVCANGHRQFAQSRLALQRLLQLGDDAAGPVPLGAERGRLFKRAVCPVCDVVLERRSRGRETFHIEMRVGAAPPFGIDLTVPVCRCPACGKAHARSRKEIRGRAPTALLDALRTAGIGAR